MMDWTRIEELQNDLGEDDFSEIAGLFLSEILETVETLPTAAVAELPDRLHGLKGSALNLGFTELADLCEAGEQAPDAADIAALKRTASDSVAAFVKAFPA